MYKTTKISKDGIFDTVTQGSLYQRGYRGVSFETHERPHRASEWLWYLWGLDIFFDGVPLMKTTVALNLCILIVHFLMLRQGSG